MSDPRIDSMHDEAEKFARLFRDPQPGLSTWADFVRERVEAINTLWFGRKRAAEECDDDLHARIATLETFIRDNVLAPSIMCGQTAEHSEHSWRCEECRARIECDETRAVLLVVGSVSE